jgi:hypothetical protein
VTHELIVYRSVYPGQAVIVATVLAIVPYLLFRGLVARLARRRSGGKAASADHRREK